MGLFQSQVKPPPAPRIEAIGGPLDGSWLEATVPIVHHETQHVRHWYEAVGRVYRYRGYGPLGSSFMDREGMQ